MRRGLILIVSILWLLGFCKTAFAETTTVINRSTTKNVTQNKNARFLQYVNDEHWSMYAYWGQPNFVRLSENGYVGWQVAKDLFYTEFKEGWELRAGYTNYWGFDARTKKSEKKVDEYIK